MDYFKKRLEDAAFKIDLSMISDEDKKAIKEAFNQPQSEEARIAQDNRLNDIVAEALVEYYQNRR